MKSKITIDYHFDESGVMKPVLKVLWFKSGDVRDKLLQDFLQDMGFESSWLKRECIDPDVGGLWPDGGRLYHIEPEPDVEKLLDEVIERRAIHLHNPKEDIPSEIVTKKGHKISLNTSEIKDIYSDPKAEESVAS